jgi:hypothetical protein
MTSPPSLTALQHWLQAVITNPDGITPGIESADARSQVDIEAADINSVVLPSKSLTSEQRLAVYGNAYFARLLECMQEMFPALRYALEDDVFDQFAFGYLTSHPPHSYTLEHLSDRFIDFLRATREQLADEEDAWPDFVIDLARLEFYIDRVFDGPGIEQTEHLSATALQQIDPNLWPQATLEPVVCLRLLAFRFPVNDYYTAYRAVDTEHDPPLPLPDAQPNYLALTRRNFVVRRYPLSHTQYELLSALAEGRPVGEAIALAAESADHLDHLAAHLSDWFQAWTAAEFFATVNVPAEP